MATSTTARNAQTATGTPRVPKFRASCDNCHSLKVRCGQEKPNCFRCENNNVDCVYGISRRMGKPKGGSKAAAANNHQSKRSTLSSPTDRKRAANSSVDALRSQSPLKQPPTSRQRDGSIVPQLSDLDTPLSNTSPSSVCTAWQEHPWSASPHSSHPFYTPSGMYDPVEIFNSPAAFAESGSAPLDGRYLSVSSSSKSSAVSDLEPDVGPLGSNQLTEDLTSWWDYFDNGGTGPALADVPDLFSLPNTFAELPPLFPTQSSCTQMRFSTPSTRPSSTGGLRGSSAKPCTHYLSLLQNLTTLETVLCSPDTSPALFPGSPDIEAAQFARQSNQAFPDQHSHGTRNRLNLSFEQILALAKEMLGQSGEILECQSCLTDSSCLLVLTVLAQKVVGLYQAGAEAYGICTDHHHSLRQYSRDANGSIPACQMSRIRVGKHELDPAEERALARNIVKSRLKELAEVLDRLGNAAEKLPGDGEQVSACKNALGHAWSKLRFVSGIVDTY